MTDDPHVAATPVAPFTRVDLLVVATLVLVAAVLPSFIGIAAGIATIPRNDDWAYRAIALDWYRHGTLTLGFASRAFVIGQVAAVLPLLAATGGDQRVFVVFGTLAGMLAIIAAYAVGRRLLSRPLAVLVVLTLLSVPGYLAYANSFMTDVPAVALGLTSLWLGMRGMRRAPVSVPWLVAAFLVGLFAFSIRQFAVAAPLTLAVVWLLREPRRPAARVASVAAAMAIVVVGWWITSLPEQPGAVPPELTVLSRFPAAGVSLGLCLLPATMVAWTRGRAAWRGRDQLIGAVVGTVVAVAAVAAMLGYRYGAVTLTNLASRDGTPGRDLLVGGRPALFPDPWWPLINLAAIIGTVWLGAVIAGMLGAVLRERGWRGFDPRVWAGDDGAILLVFAILSAGAFVGFGLGQQLFDRYLWPLVVPIATLLLAAAETARAATPVRSSGETTARDRRLAVPTVAVVGALVVVGVAYMLNSYAFDAGRWRVARALVNEGADPATLDAGYEWLGAHAPGPATVTSRVRDPDDLIWYASVWPNFERCTLVAGWNVRPPGMRLVDIRNGYRRLLWFGPISRFWTYVSDAPGCTSGWAPPTAGGD